MKHAPTSLPRLDTTTRSTSWRTWLALFLVTALGASWLLGTTPAAQAYEPDTTDATAPAETDWPDDIVDLFARLPIQDRGRVKPLYTWANYALWRMNDRRTCETPQGRKLGPIEWLLDVMFRPELARTYRCFSIQTSEIVTSIGVEEIAGRKKRDRYSYAELLAGRDKLRSLAHQYAHIDEKERSPVEGGIVDLSESFAEFEAVLGYLDFAREELDLSKTPELKEVFGGADAVPFSAVVAKAPDLVQAAFAARAHGGGRDAPGLEGFQLVQRAARLALSAQGLHLFQPTAQQAEEIEALGGEGSRSEIDPERWLTPFDVVGRAIQLPTFSVAEEHVAMLAALETMTASVDDTATFRRAAEDFRAESGRLAASLGLDDKLGLEVFLLADLQPFFWAKWIFVAAFVFVAISWLLSLTALEGGGAPGGGMRVARGAVDAGSWILLVAGLGLATWGIWVRCILRERPPVSTLYETVVFIAAFSVLACLVVELFTRRRIALALAPILGFAGFFLADWKEALGKEDTMPQLLAVLDTNFWLATHVTTIVIGYGASLVTAAVAHVYVLGKVFGLGKDNPGFYATLSRMIYGLLAFALLFSIIGTILGGIWANDSWGRFWGWDPKENGALMIVLWQLAMFHARLGKYIQDFGFAMAAIVLATVVSFSWWGVNLLGIGLHSYGFAKGLWTFVMSIYGVEIGVLLTGFGWRLGWPWFGTAALTLGGVLLYDWIAMGSLVVTPIVLLFAAVVGAAVVGVRALLSARRKSAPQPG